MKINYRPYTLELKHTFTISSYSRNTTPAILIEIETNGITGYGEISMPQYLGETVESASAFIEKVKSCNLHYDLGLENILNLVDAAAPGNNAAKAGLDIALHDLFCKAENVSVRNCYRIEGNLSPKISFTIGIDREEVLIKKMEEAALYDFIKVKLGSKDDKSIIQLIRGITDKKLIVDINQGWSEKEFALEMIHFLYENGVVLVEQPLEKDDFRSQEWLAARSPLPIFADEAIQRYKDLAPIKNLYHGINVKLMKCTGIREALRMIKEGKDSGLKIMLGCMTETSCGISAAAQLSPMADYADLDGNLLIKNDPFSGHGIKEGRIELNSLPGLGITKIV